jgi:hypothetical protein
MRRKKTEVVDHDHATGVVLPAKHGQSEQAEGMIDLDPVKTEHDKGDSQSAGVIDLDENTITIDHTKDPAEIKVVAEQPEPKRRKYTRRAKKTGVVVTPLFIDRDGIRAARIKAFTDYIDGNSDFTRASALDSQLKELDKMAAAVNQTYSTK